MPKVWVVLAEGSEEIAAIARVDRARASRSTSLHSAFSGVGRAAVDTVSKSDVSVVGNER